MSRNLLVALLAVAAAAGPGQTADYARKEIQDPELILETGARTAACDMLLYSRDGRRLLACGDDKVVREWSCGESGLDPRQERVLRWASYREVRGAIYTMALSDDRDQRYVVVAGVGLNPGAAALLDRETGEVVNGLTEETLTRDSLHSNWSVAFAPGSTRVALGNSLGSVYLWDLGPDRKGRQPIKRLGPAPANNAPINRVRLLTFLSETTLLAVTADGKVTRWQLGETHQAQPRPSFQHIKNLRCVAIDSRRGLLAAGGQDDNANTIEVLSLDGKERQTFLLPDPHFPTCLAFDPSGERLAVGTYKRLATPFQKILGGQVFLFDLRGGQVPKPGPTPSYYPEALAFDPVRPNRLAVAGGDNHEVAVWDLKNLTQVGPTILGPGRSLWGVGLSRNGLQLGVRVGRMAVPNHPNERSTGRWEVFDLQKRHFLPSPAATSDAFERERVPPEKVDSVDGWRIEYKNPHPHPDDPLKGSSAKVWYAVRDSGTYHPLVLEARDDIPRCYTFLKPAQPGSPPRLALGHYWGISVFEMGSQGGPPRLIRKFIGHQGEVMALAPSKNHDALVSSSRDQTVNFWSLKLLWKTHPELGASFRERLGRLEVTEVEPGSPLWHAGLTQGDKVQLVKVNRGNRMLFLYDVTGDPQREEARKLADRNNIRGDVHHCLDWLRPENPRVLPGYEVLLVWERLGDSKIHRGIARAQQRPVWRFFPAFGPQGLPQNWVVWRWQDHFYDCSPSGDRWISWQISYDENRTPEIYPAASIQNHYLKDRYHQPAAIGDTLLQKDWTPGKIVSVLDLQAPTLTLQVLDSATGTPVQTLPAGGKVKVVMRALPRQPRQNHQPERVYLWINDHRAWVAPPGDRPAPEKGLPKEYTWTREVDASELRQGLNHLTLQCYIRGNAGEEPARIELGLTKKGAAVQPRLFVVMVGVTDYKEVRKNYDRYYDRLGVPPDKRLEFKDLRGCAQDLKILYDTFKKQTPQLGEVHFTILKNNEDSPPDRKALNEERGPVSPERIIEALTKLKGQVRPDDILIFYLSGHGDADKGQSQTFRFICPHFDPQKPGLTGVTGEHLYQRLLDLRCRKLVLLDACHSGDVSVNPVRQLCLDGVGPLVISACRPDQEAIGHPALGSLFTQCVNEALSIGFADADLNKDGRLDVKELIQYIRSRLKLRVDLVNSDKDDPKEPDREQDLDYSPKNLDHTNFTLLPLKP